MAFLKNMLGLRWGCSSCVDCHEAEDSSHFAEADLDEDIASSSIPRSVREGRRVSPRSCTVASRSNKVDQGAEPAVMSPRAVGPTELSPKAAGPEEGSTAEGSTDDEQEEFSDPGHLHDVLLEMLLEVETFRRLRRSQLEELLAVVTPRTFSNGEVVIQEGAIGKEFYMIRDGTAHVMVDAVFGADGKMEGARDSETVADDQHPGAPKVLGLLKAGDYFGERALMRDEPRNASIVASSALTCLIVSRDQLQLVGGLSDTVLPVARAAVVSCADISDTSHTQMRSTSRPSSEECEFIMQAIHQNENLRAIVNLPDALLRRLANVARQQNVGQGEDIIKIGDMEAQYFYIVQEGKFIIDVSNRSKTRIVDDVFAADAATRSRTLVVPVGFEVTKGASFGELALIHAAPRAATVTALVDSVVWAIGRQHFKTILKEAEEAQRNYVPFLNRIDILKNLTKGEKEELSRAMQEMEYHRNDDIIVQGEQGDTLYVLIEGKVEIYVNSIRVNKLSANKEKGKVHFFGERALLENEPRTATVKVSSENATVLVINKESCDLLLGPMSLVMHTNGRKSTTAKTEGVSVPPASGSKLIPLPDIAPIAQATRTLIVKKDLKKLGLLGTGTFSAVELWKHKPTSVCYAVKIPKKDKAASSKTEERINNEKLILMKLDCPFIIRLHETLILPEGVSFLLEAALGGDLHGTYTRLNLHGSHPHGRYYVASVVLALEYMHLRHIIYRDLRPENLVLMESGRMKLCDMGLAKFCIGKTYTTCGTPDYLPPEMVQCYGHNRGADWWALGVLIFELMTGKPPFEADTPLKTYSKVVKGVQSKRFPAPCTGSVEDLVRNLLVLTQSQRLTMRPNGIKRLKGHAWYANFDWKALECETMDPPYRPELKHKKVCSGSASRLDKRLTTC